MESISTPPDPDEEQAKIDQEMINSEMGKSADGWSGGNREADGTGN